jgi:two-component system OmpR family sensor kinase
LLVSAATESQRRRPLRRRIAADVRTRILVSYVVLLAVASLVSVLVVRQVLLVRLDDRIQSDLAQEVDEFQRLAGGVDPETGKRFGTDVKRIFDVYLSRNVAGEGEQFVTVPRKGEARYSNSERVGDFAPPPEEVARWRQLDSSERGELETAIGPAEYLAVPVEVQGKTLGTFVVADYTAGERQEVDEAVQIVGAVAAGVLLVGTVVAFFTAGRVLGPLRDLRDGARAITGTDMSRRIEVEGEDELADLGRTFNRMLDRLAIAFASQRDFIRDISHELRTPIAVVRGHLELLAEMDPSNRTERDATIRLVTGELDRMNRFVEDLLLLAKSDQPNFLSLETVRVDDLCGELVQKVRGLAERHWRLEVSTRRSIVADPQRLTQAVMNLTRNAVEHTSEDDTVEIGAAVDGHEASIWVSDSGPGVQPEDERRIFDRFTRGRGSGIRYEGSGLGLAIVRAIAEAHGGRVELESRPAEGARFTITVPVEGPADLRALIEEVTR